MWARLFVAGISLALLLLVGRVVQLQTIPSKPMAVLGDSHLSRLPEFARRGSILDLRGRDLASIHVNTRLYADPSLIDNPRIFAQIVGDTLGYDPVQVEQIIVQRRGKRYALLDHDLTDHQLLELSQMKLRGLGTQQWVAREYPQGGLAAPILGFTDTDGNGLEGIERVFNQELVGHAGQVEMMRTVRHEPIGIPPGGYDAPEHGQNVRLTIDMVIQAIAEEELAKACQQYGAKHGELIVMEPYTGYILAMANYPTFDPNDRRHLKPDQWRNRCVTDQFEPGSIFKPFIWAMAIESGTARPLDRISTGDGFWVSSNGRRLRDTHGHGTISFADVLVLSSNIGMAIMGERMGASLLYQSVHAFGFGVAPESDLPGEAEGMVHPLNKWTHYSVTSVPMGQEVAVTPLQMVTALSAIAADGTLPRPTIRADVPLDPMSRRRVISPDTAQLVRDVMRRVVTEGTGRKAGSELYSIFGKTGTAQVPGKGGYLPDQYVGSFIAGAPLDRPQIVVGCFIHRPDRKKGFYGGIVAAPAVKQVVERSLTYLGVPPEHLESGSALQHVIDARD